MSQHKRKVHILLSAVGEHLPKQWKKNPKLFPGLTEKALEAWENREPDEKAVRFLYQIPVKYGAYFRFFTVTEKENGSLLISTGGYNE